MERRREPLPTRVEDSPPLPTAYDAALDRGLTAIALRLDDDARATIAGHVRLLIAWTSAINLTAIRDPAAIAVRHVVDSLIASAWLHARGVDRVLDLGSGGGFPGLPLAAADPRLEVTLLEPIAKKARFLEAVVTATGLAGRIMVETARAEDLARDPAQRGAWPVVTARAVASLADLIELSFPLLPRRGSLLAWKQGDLADELDAGRRAMATVGEGSLEVIDVDVDIDGLQGHRLVVATRTGRGRIPAGYPRDPGARRRRPW